MLSSVKLWHRFSDGRFGLAGREAISSILWAPGPRPCSPIRSWGSGCYLSMRHSPMPVRVCPDQPGLGLRGFLDNLPVRAALHTARAIEVVEVAANCVAHKAL